MLAHGHDFGNYGSLSPIDAEDLCELPQVRGGSLTDGKDCIAEPAHAKIAQLLIKELDAQLAGKQRNIFDDGQSDTPLLVFSQLYNSRQQRLGQEVNANDWFG